MSHTRDRVAAFRLRPSRIGYTAERGERFQRSLLDRVGARPYTLAAAVARVGPGRGWCCPVAVALPEEPSAVIEVENNDVSAGFFRALGFPIVAGREFDERDGKDATPVVVVNETLSRRLWPQGDAVDRTLMAGEISYRVIGVVRDFVAWKSGERPMPYLYFSYWQKELTDSRLFARVSGDATAMIPVLRREILAIDPDVHVGQESTLRERVEMTFSMEKLLERLLSFSGFMALALSAIGLYAALAFAVNRRRREIAVRLAVGARPAQVFRLVLSEGLCLASSGIAVGIAMSLAAARVLTSYLYGVGPSEPRVFLLVSVLLLIVSIAACATPAHTATRVEPVLALRAE